MPYTNLPENLWGKMDSCVEQVQATGKDKDAAIAICYTVLTESCTAMHNLATPTEHYVEAELTPQPDTAGRVWDVTILGPSTPADLITVHGREYVRSKNGRLYLAEALKNSVQLWEGCKAYDNHLTDAEFAERAGMRSFLSEGVGIITEPHYDAAAHSLCGVLKIVDGDAAQKLLDAHNLGVLQHIGLSIDAFTTEGLPVTIEGRQYDTVEGFEKVLSVDIVSQPAAGGRFNRLIAAIQNKREAMNMDEEQLKAMIAAIVAETLAALGVKTAPSVDGAPEMEAANPDAEKAAQVVADAAQQAIADAGPEATPAEVVQAAAAAAQQIAATIVKDLTGEATEGRAHTDEKRADERLRLLECKLLLRERLDAAKLPEGARGIVETAFSGRAFESKELDMVIKSAKAAQAAADPSGRVTGLGGLTYMLDESDQRAIGFMEAVWGQRALRALESNDAHYVKERLPEWFNSYVRAGRPSYRSNSLHPLLDWYSQVVKDPLHPRTTEANDVGSITKNALNVMLASAYSARAEWWAPIVREEEVTNINDTTLVRQYGFSNLDIVAEGAAYTQTDMSDAEETASFVKHGNYVGVTLETMLKDQVGALRNIPTMIANAWYNTLSAKVAAVFTTNTATGPVLTDTGALFNATALTSAGGHANLLTAALSFTAYGAARTAMLKQTDKVLGVGNRLLIEPRYLLVPVDLETTALQIRNSQYQPVTGNNDVNPYYQAFDVVKVPEWTDVTDWALVADPQLHPAIFLIFVNGYRVPQIITAGDEASGAVFSNDTWRYKVRLMTYRFSPTYDCAPVADWRPLHKNNV